MKQILQDLRSGQTIVADVPTPNVGTGKLLIRSSRTLISAGTERTAVDFGRANLVNKARQQPDKVREVLDKVRSDGLLATAEAVRSKLDQPLQVGYCNVGVVEAIGREVEGYRVGDRVVSNGTHAEFVSVPQNLCARIPDAVGDDEAAFTVLGAIALQGIRLAKPTLGECFAVIGLGLIGLITVQLLRAHGCRVLGIDPDESKLALARAFGAETVNAAGDDLLARADAFSRGRGMDGVLLTLASKSDEPVSQAARMSRKRGRIVLVGVTGLAIRRQDFYEKELSFQVSCSYGPGRYDPDYEDRGRDYPAGFVRWTEQRNFEAVLDMMVTGQLDVGRLTSHRFAVDDAPRAYDLLASDDELSLGIVLEYDARRADPSPSVALTDDVSGRAGTGQQPSLGVIGAGNYAGRVLVPAFHAAGAHLATLASSGGVSARHFGRKFGFKKAVADAQLVLDDPQVTAVVVATRHDTHARFVCDALRAGKSVFVEKPLALTDDELDQIEATYRAPPSDGVAPPVLMVGFNRRFSPLTVQLKKALDNAPSPKCFVITINAGDVPSDHWTHDPEVGGGRIIGEACHFIDLMRFLAAAPITQASIATVGRVPGLAVSEDKAAITLSFADGSFGTVHYLANGHKAFPKERIEVFVGGRVAQLDNFRRLRMWGWPDGRGRRLWKQDKGQRQCAAAFVDAVAQGRPAPIAFDELMEVGRTTVDLALAARA